jgi:superoxide dismutase
MKTMSELAGAVVLASLPDAENVLEPVISAQMVHIHYAKHRQG